MRPFKICNMMKIQKPVLKINYLTRKSLNYILELWHLRLGHASNTVLNHIFCIKTTDSCTIDCHIRPSSKQIMLTFHLHSSSHTSTMLELLYIDVPSENFL